MVMIEQEFPGGYKCPAGHSWVNMGLEAQREFMDYQQRILIET